jgi:hypothetical protein
MIHRRRGRLRARALPQSAAAMEAFPRREASMYRHVTPRQFFKDVAITWGLALLVGLAVGGASAGVILFINSVTL